MMPKKSDRLTLSRPIGLLPHAPVAHKITEQRWILANSAKKNRCIFISNHVIKGWWMWICIVFFSSISFVRISYKAIWLKTWSWYKNSTKNESWKGLNWYFLKDSHQKAEAHQWGSIWKNRLLHLWNVQNHLIRNFLRNGRVRVKVLQIVLPPTGPRLGLKSPNCRYTKKTWRTSISIISYFSFLTWFWRRAFLVWYSWKPWW